MKLAKFKRVPGLLEGEPCSAQWPNRETGKNEKCTASAEWFEVVTGGLYCDRHKTSIEKISREIEAL